MTAAGLCRVLVGEFWMKTLLISLSIAFVLLAAQAVFAQRVKRIQFAKGKSSATVSGSTGAYGTTFVVRARSGQKIVLKLTPATGVGIKVESDGQDGQNVLLREESGGSYEVGLERSGDYTIFIGSTNGRSAHFTLTVSITKMTDI
jgi:opacity protein-like surface antigen